MHMVATTLEFPERLQSCSVIGHDCGGLLDVKSISGGKTCGTLVDICFDGVRPIGYYRPRFNLIHPGSSGLLTYVVSA